MKNTKKENEKALKIGKIVSNYYDFHLKELFVNTRKREISEKRQLIQYLCSKYTSLTTEGIGNCFKEYGKTFDHATVLHSKKKIQNIIDTEPKYRDEVKMIEIRICRSLVIFKKKQLSTEEKEFRDLRMRVVRACRMSKTKDILVNELMIVI